MPERSIEELGEEIVMQILRAHPVLSGKKIVHENTAGKADVDCIVCSGVQQERDLAGPGGYRVNVTAEYRSMSAAVSQNDAIARAMREAIENSASASIDVLDQLSDLYVLNEEIRGDRGNTKSLRKRSLEIPLILKQK